MFMPRKIDFAEIMDKYVRGVLTTEEKDTFFSMFNQEELDPGLEDYLLQNYLQNADSQIWPEEFRAMFAERLANKILFKDISQETAVAHRGQIFKTTWLKYAAIVVVAAGLGIMAYFRATNKNTVQTLAGSNKHLQTDVLPGSEKAILTLADGTKIILDNAANGNLAQQGNAQVVKLANGQIAYDVKGLSDKDIMWNTMSTPVGGQYQVTLPDGTRVWLNAASSVTYPAVFVSQNRQVKITGEVYFEVAKNKEKPFIVDIDGKSTVEVLGTSFNINSYTDEASIKTTLLDGSVKISSVVLKQPGQQAVQAENDKIYVQSTDINQALAWKNGLFSFNDADLHSIMRQLERWYDIKVKYEGRLPDFTLNGEMYRNVNLSVVLKFLEKMGVKFRMEGKILTVTGQ